MTYEASRLEQARHELFELSDLGRGILVAALDDAPHAERAPEVAPALDLEEGKMHRVLEDGGAMSDDAAEERPDLDGEKERRRGQKRRNEGVDKESSSDGPCRPASVHLGS